MNCFSLIIKRGAIHFFYPFGHTTIESLIMKGVVGMNLCDFPITLTKKAMHDANKKCTVGVISGVLAGMAAGAALGILFAPQSGRASRKILKQKMTQLTDQMQSEGM